MGLLAGAGVVGFDAGATGHLIGALDVRFGLDARTGSWFLGLYVLGMLIGAPLGGYLAARWGSSATYRGSTLPFALGALLCALDSSFELTLVGRLVQGLGAGPLLPVIATIITEANVGARKGRWLSLTSLVYGLAFLIGVGATPQLLAHGTSSVFVIELGVVLGAGLLAAKRAHTRTHAGFDAKGMVLLVLMLGILSITVNRVNNQAELVRQALPALVVVSLLLGILALVEQRARAPLFPPELFRVRRVWVLCLVSLGTGLGQALIIALPLLASLRFELSGLTVTPLMYPLVAGGLLTGVFAVLWLDRLGGRAVAMLGSAATLSGALLLASPELSRFGFSAAAFLLGSGVSALSGGALRLAAARLIHADLASTIQSTITLLTNVGVLLGSVLFGALAVSQPSPGLSAQAVAFGFAPLLFVTLGCAILLPARGSSGVLVNVGPLPNRER